MTETPVAGKAPATIRVDQFVAAPPAKVWRLGYGRQPCNVRPGWRDVVLPRLSDAAARA